MSYQKPRLLHQYGTRAAQPAADHVTVAEGALYYVTDEGKIERSSGSAWEEYSPAVTFAAYTPTWSSVGVAPALGNGTITGFWSRVGELIFFRIVLTAGNTTTFGTGAYTFTLPFNALDNIVNVLGKARDDSVPANYMGYALGSAAGVIQVGMPSATAGVPGPGFKVDTPMTWATSDTLIVEGFYREA